MGQQISEKMARRIRWILTMGWLILIGSLFYDPVTAVFTQSDQWASPFHLNPSQCVQVQGRCLPQTPYALGTMIWWSMIVPAAIAILFVLGHDLWRRICPLSFLSQIPRALGIQRQRRVLHPVTGQVQLELISIGADSWLGKYHLGVQFGLFVCGLGLRILCLNTDRTMLGIFLRVTIAAAITVGYLYAGKSWCQYFCPMGPVQMVLTGPRSLLGKPASAATIPQSMCRTLDPQTGQEQSACVGCKATCIDIDAEKSYWSNLDQPGRRLVQYGYLGMVVAFFGYHFLYAGNWNYYFSGAWTHEPETFAQWFAPGFQVYGHILPVPKVLAVALTFGLLTTAFVALGGLLEKLYRRYGPGQPISAQQAQHRVFTVFTVAAFWIFFAFGWRPLINKLPTLLILGFNALLILVGAFWLHRTWRRTPEQYDRETMADNLRRQLQQMDFGQAEVLEGRSIAQLSADEVYTLVKVLPGFSHQLRLQAYTEILRDLLQQQAVTPAMSIEFCRNVRQELKLQDADHFNQLELLFQTGLVCAPPPPIAADDQVTVAKTIVKRLRRKSPES
jgi:hypothetical protein